MVRAWERLGSARLVVIYLVAMPLLAGLPRGGILPVLRPSEGLQLGVTGLALLVAARAGFDGGRWEVRIRSHEWWLAAMVVAGSVAPVLWIVARSQPVTADVLLAAFPLVKYGALYLLVRACVTRTEQLGAVLTAAVGVAVALSVLAVAQAVQLGPTAELIGRVFVSSADDVADGGRATTTIGSSIATGALLSLVYGVVLSRALMTGRYRWLAAVGVVGLGALASGQAGTVIALVLITATVVALVLRAGLASPRFPWRGLLMAAVPALGAVALILTPVVAERMNDLNRGSGLPTSWLVRWNNVSELYLPPLRSGGWILGVSPDTELVPPDLWRETVYLESGYLWLLWVGGVPLLVATLGFLRAAWRSVTIDPTTSPDWSATAGIAARAGVAMMVVLSLIDPHLTLRAGADMFFVLVALASTPVPLARPIPPAAPLWRTLTGADAVNGRRPSFGVPHPSSARIQIREVTTGDGDGRPRGDASAPARQPGRIVLSVEVGDRGRTVARSQLTMALGPSDSRGWLGPVTASDNHSAWLLMRAVVLVAGSMRLDQLRVGAAGLLEDPTMAAPRSPEGKDRHAGLVFDRFEIVRAARMARRLERRRTSHVHVVEAIGGGHRDAVRLDVEPTIPVWKRAMDLVLGSLAILLSAPLWLPVAVAVRRSGPGPVLFRQLRIGLGGTPFTIYKFRTMHVDNDDSAHRRQNEREMAGEADGNKDEHDPRITSIGRVLRRLSLDELPQLINVMRGEMSLVGPRPSLLWEVQLFPAALRRRLTVAPGITGLWQTSGRADLSLPEMLELDLRYVDELSPGSDLRCLARTAGAVVGGEGAS